MCSALTLSNLPLLITNTGNGASYMPGFNVPDTVNNMKVCLQDLVRENYQEFHQASDNAKKKRSDESTNSRGQCIS